MAPPAGGITTPHRPAARFIHAARNRPLGQAELPAPPGESTAWRQVGQTVSPATDFLRSLLAAPARDFELIPEFGALRLKIT